MICCHMGFHFCWRHHIWWMIRGIFNIRFTNWFNWISWGFHFILIRRTKCSKDTISFGCIHILVLVRHLSKVLPTQLRLWLILHNFLIRVTPSYLRTWWLEKWIDSSSCRTIYNMERIKCFWIIKLIMSISLCILCHICSIVRLSGLNNYMIITFKSVVALTNQNPSIFTRSFLLFV